MSDDNVVEIDFDEDIEETLDTGEVDLPSMEDNASNANSKILQVGVLGDNNIAKSIGIIFGTTNDTNKINVQQFEDIDSAVASNKIHLYFVCTEPALLKDDVIDDVAIIDMINKISNQTKASVVLKSTVALETIESIYKVIHADRFVYSPEDTCDDNLINILESESFLIGGTPKSIESFQRLVNTCSPLDRKMIVSNPYDIAMMKLTLSAWKAVEQTFWNQVYDYGKDSKSNFNMVKKTISAITKDSRDKIPTFVRAKADGNSFKKSKSFSGEYTNRDVRVFAGSTDRLPLLDECINYKNLKD